VNLGCGYDPLPFVYLADSKIATFVDIDFPELIQNKSTIIRNTPALSNTIKPYLGSTSGEIRTQNYFALGCDLTNLLSFDQVLQSISPDFHDSRILFISEVAITYMPTTSADSLISFTSQFAHSSFAIIEQITPAGTSHPFAVTMQNHFTKLSTPLLSLSQYPTLRSQVRRFLEAGYTEVEACDLNAFYHNIIQPETNEIELFDEYEELSAFLGHYFVLVAKNDKTQSYLRPNGTDWQYINWNKDVLLNGKTIARNHCHDSRQNHLTLSITSLDIQKPIHRRFTSIAPLDNGVFIFGGLSNTSRLSSSIQLRPETHEAASFQVSGKPSARMCHTLTPLNDACILLVGGREAPNAPKDDVWIFDGDWKQAEPFPQGGIYRHAAVQISPDKAIVYGGRGQSRKPSSSWFLYTYLEGWQELKCDDSPALWGACISWNEGKGVLVGGVNDEGDCQGDVYSFEIDLVEVKLKKWDLDEQTRTFTRRFGAKAIPRGSSDVLIIGGAGSRRVIPWSEQCLQVSLADQTVSMVSFLKPDGVEPWLIGHDVAIARNNSNIIVAGGGGVCFSFGSFWNDKALRLDHPDFPNTFQWKLLEETNIKLPDNSSVVSSSTTPENLPRVQITQAEQWHQILRLQKPCVLEGLNLGACIQKWTPEYLKKNVGPEKPVIIHVTDSQAMNFLSKNFKYESRSFAHFIDSVFSPTQEKVYLRAVSDDAKNKPAKLEDDFPNLAKDFEIPDILCGSGGIDTDRIFSSVLRVGGVGTSMWLHYDVNSLKSKTDIQVMANILTQIVGEKEVLVFHPSLVNELDIPPGASSSSIEDVFCSSIREKASHAILKPGDILYIPPLWPHATKPLTPNVGVNVFWKNFPDEVYDKGRDVYGNKDLLAYNEGRKLVDRIARGFKGISPDAREFYLKRLLVELEELSRSI